MKKSYIVATGIVQVPLEAESPLDAIAVLKLRIDDRRREPYNELIGMSLVEALDADRLNFLVLDAGCSRLLGGEVKGRFQSVVSRDLLEAMKECFDEPTYQKLVRSLSN